MKIIYVLILTLLVSCSRQSISDSEKSIKYEVTVSRNGAPVGAVDPVWYTLGATGNPFAIYESTVNNQERRITTTEGRIKFYVIPHDIDHSVMITGKIYVDGVLRYSHTAKDSVKDRPVIDVNIPIN
jgi:hypothetical protein